MSAFPVVAFNTAPWSGPIMLVVGAHVHDAGYLWPVIAGEDNDSVVSDTELFQSRHEFTYDMIQFQDEVTVRSG